MVNYTLVNSTAHTAKSKSPNTGKPINCVNCHGNISEDHRRGAKDVMRFDGDIFGDKNQCIPRKNKTKFVLLVTNRQNFVKTLGTRCSRNEIALCKLPHITPER